MDITAEFERLRRQRNRWAIVAVVTMVGSMAVCLPRALQRRNELKSANEELLKLQQAIRQTQEQTRQTQSEILQLQSDIKKAMEVR